MRVRWSVVKAIHHFAIIRLPLVQRMASSAGKKVSMRISCSATSGGDPKVVKVEKTARGVVPSVVDGQERRRRTDKIQQAPAVGHRRIAGVRAMSVRPLIKDCII